MKELNGMILAQNNEQFMGYTVFNLPFTENARIKFMTLADVKAIVEKIKSTNPL